MQGGDTMKEEFIVIGSLFTVVAISVWAIELNKVSSEFGFLIGVLDSLFLWGWVKYVDMLRKR